MHQIDFSRVAAAFFLAIITTGLSWGAPVAVYQRGYTPGVTGANMAETTLTTANVAAGNFGRIFSLPVDGRIYAEPLYVPALTLPGQGTHNVLFVATMTNSIFAFDADVAGPPLWSASYIPPGGVSLPISSVVGTDSLNIAGTVGIEGTPVIDPTTNTMYFVTNTVESSAEIFRLHAIDITNGAEKNGGPVVINGSVTVAGKTVAFNPSVQNQRVSLTLAQHAVMIGFGSHEDEFQYYGWLMAYDETSLAQIGIFNSEPTAGYGAGFWQSGNPPAVDSAGYVYIFAGNAFPASSSSIAADGVANFSESALKLNPGQGLKVIDYFTPAGYQSLDTNDEDLSSSGPTLIPGTNLLVGGGKSGTTYLLNTQNMGHLQAGDAGAAQSFTGSIGPIRGGSIFWARSTAGGGPMLFDWGAYDALKSFTFSGTSFNTTPAATYRPPVNIYPGGVLSLSSNGDNQGIVWALINLQGDADHRVPPGGMVAVSAANVSQALWSSTAVPARDDFGLYGKWVPPLVSNGKVYVATSSNQVVVYGLLPAAGTVTMWPAAQATLGGSAAFVVNALSPAGKPQTATWSVSGLPSGATGSFSTNAQGQTVLQISTANTTPENYTVQATATVNGLVISQTALLKVVGNAAVTAAAVTADSAQAGNPPSNATDGNAATFWQSEYTPALLAYPHSINIDLGSVQQINGISYLARQDGCINGTELQYEVHVSTDGSNYQEITGGSFDYGPDWLSYSCSGSAFFLPKQQDVTFPTTSARYVNLVALGSVIDGNPWASAAEVKVYAASGTSPAAQSVTFAAIASQTAGATLSLAAKSSSGLAVSYSSSTPTVCTVSGAKVTLLTAGTCTIVASQAGNGADTPATSVEQSFSVAASTAPTATVVNVNLSSVDHVYALANAATPTVNGGLDGVGYSLAANLLGSSITWSGNAFTLGTASAASGVAATTIALPSGTYTSLQFLATGSFGPILNQTFTVAYTDGTTSSVTQSISDWGYPQSFAGESIASSTSYRIQSNGTTQAGPWYVYGYKIALNAAKTLKSITLPSSTHVVVLAMDLVPSSSTTPTPPTTPPTAIVSGQNYEISVDSDGDALTASGTGGGAAVVQQPWSGATSQLWTVLNGSASGYYELKNVASGLALNMSGLSVTNGGLAILWPYQNGAATNDEWKLVPDTQLGNSLFEIQNVNSGLALEVPGSSTTSGTQFDQFQFGPANLNQVFTLTPH